MGHELACPTTTSEHRSGYDRQIRQDPLSQTPPIYHSLNAHSPDGTGKCAP